MLCPPKPSSYLADLSGANILGINPPAHDFTFFDLWSKPVGLLNILGYLRGRGNNVRLVDCVDEGRVKPLSYGRWKIKREILPRPHILQNIPRRYSRFGLSPTEIKDRLRAEPVPDIILITSIMTYWYPGVFEAIALAREVFPKTPIGLGGIYATLCPDHAQGSGADFLLTSPLPEINSPLPLDLYPSPNYGVILTSRGCPRRCHYCASSKLVPIFQSRPLGDVFSDIAHQASLESVTDLAFYDDALLLEPSKRFYPICEHLKQNYPHLRLHTPNGLSVDSLDEKCCQVLFESGFKTLRLSLEGIDPATEALSTGKAGRASFEGAVQRLLKVGYPSEALETYLLVGLPGQTPKVVEANIEYVKGLGASPRLAEFSPIPGTKLFKESIKEHPILDTEPLWHNNTIYLNHLAGSMSSTELQHLKNLTRPGRSPGPGHSPGPS